MTKATPNGFFHTTGKTILAVFAIFSVCLLAYHNSLRNDFLIDDYALILDNPQFHNIDYLPRQLIPDLHRYLRIDQQEPAVYYRPVAHIIPMLCYLMFGNDPFGYHVFNLVLFFGTCLSIFWLCRELSGDLLTGFLASVLYAVHPMNGLFVNYISASVFAVQVMTLSFSMVLFLKVIRSGKKKIARLCFSIFLFIIALLCHETSFAFPLLLAAAAVFVEKAPVKKAAALTSGFFAVAAGFFVFRLFFASLRSGLFGKFLTYGISLWQYPASFAKVIGWYLSRLVYPEGIVLIWSTLPVRQHILWMNSCFFLAVVSALFVLWRYRNKNKIITLGVLFVLIVFMPAVLGSMFNPSVGFMIEPHWMFFPSIGFFLLLAAALRYLFRENAAMSVCVILLIVVPWLLLTWRMNRVWSTELGYASYWARQVPHDKAPRFYMAHAYQMEGDYARAEKFFSQSLVGDFYDWMVYSNLGVMAFQENNLKKAEEYFQKVLAISPRMAVVHSNLGLVYKRQGRADLAETHFRQAIEDDPYLLPVRVNLALLYENKKKYAEARDLYEENLRINPDDKMTIFNLTGLYLKEGNKEQAAVFAERFLKASGNAESLTQLGIRCAQGGVGRPAVALLKKAIKVDPKDQSAYVELGKIFANYEEWRKAYFIWEMGEKATGDQKTFQSLIERAKKMEKESKGR